MGKRHSNYRLIKINLPYSVDELARVLGVHKNTVRAWQKAGLQPVDNRRPVVFRGAVVALFLKSRRERNKRPCGVGELYCLPCRQARRPAGDMVDYLPSDSATGNLRGICPTCDRFMHRRVNLARLAAVIGDLDVTFPEGEQHLRETTCPSVNHDSDSEER